MAYLILENKDIPVSDHVRIIFDWGGCSYIGVADNQLWQKLFLGNNRPGNYADDDLRFPADWDFGRYPIPDDLEINGILDVSETGLNELPRRLRCKGLKLNPQIKSLPRDIIVDGPIQGSLSAANIPKSAKINRN